MQLRLKRTVKKPTVRLEPQETPKRRRLVLPRKLRQKLLHKSKLNKENLQSKRKPRRTVKLRKKQFESNWKQRWSRKD